MGCKDPIFETVEESDRQIIIDDTTENRTFKTILDANQEFLPFVVIDEAYTFFKNMIHKKKGTIRVSTWCRLFDGGCRSQSRCTSKKVRLTIRNAEELLS